MEYADLLTALTDRFGPVTQGPAGSRGISFGVPSGKVVVERQKVKNAATMEELQGYVDGLEVR